MTEDSLEQEINISKLFNQLFNLFLDYKLYVILLIILSVGYSFYMNKKVKPVYTSTTIIDTRDVVEIDIMREIINDFFKYIKTSPITLENNSILNVHSYKKRDAAKLFPQRLYMDVTIDQTNFKPIEIALVKYINQRNLIKRSIEDKKQEYRELIKVIDNMDSSNMIVTEETLNVTINRLKYKRELTQLNNYNPIINSFSIPNLSNNYGINTIEHFIKVFISGLFLLFLYVFFKKKLV